jgi:hypothetical protein
MAAKWILTIVILGLALQGSAFGYEIVTNQEILAPNETANVHVDCPAGLKVLGGGFNIEDPDLMRLLSSGPEDGNGNIIDNAWNLLIQNIDTNDRQATVSAICGKVKEKK